jgi:hypothetical protein
MMLASPVDRMHAEFHDVLSIMERSGEISLLSVLSDNFRKSLLLCAASFFERRLTEVVLEFVREKSHPTDLIPALVQNKAISRQYHSWFDWDRSNANKFFSLFGDRFKTCMEQHVAADPELRAAVSSFIEIGRDRNRLVHQDYGTFLLEKTADDIYDAYIRALKFVDGVPTFLRRYEV